MPAPQMKAPWTIELTGPDGKIYKGIARKVDISHDPFDGPPEVEVGAIITEMQEPLIPRVAGEVRPLSDDLSSSSSRRKEREARTVKDAAPIIAALMEGVNRV